MLKRMLIIILIIIAAFLILLRLHNKIKNGGMLKSEKRSYKSEKKTYISWFDLQIEKFPDGKDFMTPKENPELLTFFSTALSINNGVNLNDFHFTKTSIFSTTAQDYSEEIINYMATKLCKDSSSFELKLRSLQALTLTDGTSCVGGDTILMAHHFNHVNAVEYDKTNYDALVHNIDLFPAVKNKIKSYHGDFTIVSKTLNQDVVFLDPPWGGLDYKEQSYITLYLSNIPVQEIVSQIPSAFFLKVPVNFNFDEYNNFLRSNFYRYSESIYIHNFNNKRKIKFVIVYTSKAPPKK